MAPAARCDRSRSGRAWWSVLPLIAAVVLVGLPAPAALAVWTAPCGGRHPVKPGGGLYKCTFDDEFSGSTLDGTKWWVPTTRATGYHIGAECFIVSPNNISIGGGVLSLTVRKEAAPFFCPTPTGGYTTQYTSATVNTLGRFSQAYGRFEIRAKFPAATVAGLQSSLWMLSTTNTYGSWPTTGEIDIAEAYSQYPDRVIPYVHYAPVGGVDPQATNNYCLITPGQFHVYAVQWTTTSITITFDGRTCVSDNWNPAPPLVKPAPFDQPFLIALTQALGVNGNAVNPYTQLPATTQIDYVRIWS
jgi:beta-glucanase (GH16 family)